MADISLDVALLSIDISLDVALLSIDLRESSYLHCNVTQERYEFELGQVIRKKEF